MKRFWAYTLLVFLIAGFIQSAFAQNGSVSAAAPYPAGCQFGIVTNAQGLPACASAPASTALPPNCANGFGTDANGKPTACLPIPVGGGCIWTVVAYTDNPHNVTAADGCKMLTWSGAAASSVVLPAPSSMSSNFQTCFDDYSVQPISFAGAPMKGGVSKINHNDWVCPQPDGQGNWSMPSGGPPDDPNVNALP